MLCRSHFLISKYLPRIATIPKFILGVLIQKYLQLCPFEVLNTNYRHTKEKQIFKIGTVFIYENRCILKITNSQRKTIFSI
jgi:hypothetical protein